MKRSKVKVVIISLVFLTVIIVLILGGMFVFYYVDTQIVSKPEESKPEVRPLTEEEQTFVGVWKADDGSLLAVRARGGYEAEQFALDAIYYIPNENHEWGKITRNIDTTLEKDEERFEYKTVFHRTNRDPTDKSIDWDWYYDIHPYRKL